MCIRDRLSADAGYYSEDNLIFLEEAKIEAFIPPDKVKHSEWREAKPPRGRIPKNANRRYLMRRKLRTKHGRARYRLRQTSVEPVFGFIKEQLKLRQFLHRGLDTVSYTHLDVYKRQMKPPVSCDNLSSRVRILVTVTSPLSLIHI